MKNYKPELIGEVGKMKFVLSQGTETKEFYCAGGLNEETGTYAILNENNEVVEYMDILGNFTNEPTSFALDYFNYCASNVNVPYILSQYCNVMYSGLVDFPSRYMVDENIKKMIIKEEKRRFWELLRTGRFNSLLDAVRYKHYINHIIKQKLRRVEWYKSQNKETIQEQEINK